MTSAERHYTLLFRAQRPDLGMQQCFHDARRHISFKKRLEADVAAHARRSKAAKKAWRVRKAAAKAAAR